MATSLSTVVLVHGAWHTPPIYKSYIDALKAQGFTVHCPRLSSCNGASPPDASLPDIPCMRGLIKSLVETGELILMALYSYSGAVGTDAVEELAFSVRKASGLSGEIYEHLNKEYGCGTQIRSSFVRRLLQILGAPLIPGNHQFRVPD